MTDLPEESLSFAICYRLFATLDRRQSDPGSIGCRLETGPVAVATTRAPRQPGKAIR
jgi:hypothetical protein